ncbi:cupin [Microtetraspora sp. NBRC 13810]|uniref:cupin domain-containing protein n=1 Tax=Microtetraspora sp. NBRC 13810 TaxID=3030990 RepID=UPI0024A311BF|nr:cupin domain-containing protein [Microtetraspora sp. NBRC 13810]GLW06986.1 cupin [Microtetraspora sp. NBRC 13810]
MPDTEAVLTRADRAERLGEGPNGTWLLADADETGGVMNAVRTTLGPGTDGPPPHYHEESPELFFMLDGALRMLTGDRIVTIGRGDFLLVPPRMTHAWGTPDDTGADVLIIKAPANNRFDYFRLADRVRRGEASPREILETQERFDNHFVDSPLWRRATASGGGRVNLVDL